MDLQRKIDYLVIGHICHDLSPEGLIIGGAAAYAGALAKAAGCRTAVVTSSSPDDDWQPYLPDVSIHSIPADHTTVFENVYTPLGRKQTIHSVANKIRSQDIPSEWRRASIVHFGPIANEVDPEVILLFSNSLVGLAPQGWMRRWDETGRVFAEKWQEAENLLRHAAVVFISDEDLADDHMLVEYRRWSRILVMTQGPQGCTVFLEDEAHHFPVKSGPVIDLTGAGDIFASAFLIRLYQTAGNPLEAARFANEIAALSIQFAGLRSKIEALVKHGLT